MVQKKPVYVGIISRNLERNITLLCILHQNTDAASTERFFALDFIPGLFYLAVRHARCAIYSWEEFNGLQGILSNSCGNVCVGQKKKILFVCDNLAVVSIL